MGQVTSRISGLFGDQSDKVKEKETKSRNHDTNKSPPKKNKELNSSSYFPFGIMATPRNPLKRSRQISPIVSVPQSILDIFSPTKKAKIEEEFLDFTFLDENETIEYYKKSKILIILRGLPGSGKSTIAKSVKRRFPSSKICSADNFFMKDDEYVYDRTLIKEAHAQCQEDSIKAVQDQISLVVIDNTNLKRWEMKFYLDLAKSFNYIPVIVEAKTPWRRDVAVLVSKTVHNLDESILESKKNDFEDLLPSYYGWFLNEKDSFLFLDEGRMWIETVSQIPEFMKEFKLYSGLTTLQDLMNYYEPSERGNLHCTANYIGKILSPEKKEYIKKCEAFVGKSFYIEVVSFVFTPRTFGARVKLSDEQLLLWAKNDNEEFPQEFWDPVQIEEDIVEQEILVNGHDNSDLVNETEDSEGQNNITADNSNDLIKENDSEVDKSNDSLNNFDSSTKDTINHTNGIEDEDNNSSHSLENSISPLKNQNNSPSLELIKEISHVTKENSLLEVNGLDKSWDAESSPKKNIGKINGLSPLKKSPRKQKSGILIPENTLKIEESVTKDTITLQAFNIPEEEKFIPTRGLGSRAHLTLGCSPGVKPSVTGLDMIFAIQNEVKAKKGEQLNENSNKDVLHEIYLEGATLRSYGNGVWVIYLEETIKVKSVFSATY